MKNEKKGAATCCPETNAPEKVERQHIGATILYKLPNQAVISEGQIEAISPGLAYFRVGSKRWLPNQPGSVLSILNQKQKPTRRGIKVRH